MFQQVSKPQSPSVRLDVLTVVTRKLSAGVWS